MTDIASLGLEVRSDAAVKASSDLDRLTAAAAKAERAAAGVGSSTDRMGSAVSKAAERIERMVRQIDRTERQLAAARREIDLMDGATQRAATSASKVELALQRAFGSSATWVRSAQAALDSYNAALRKSASEAESVQQTIGRVTGVSTVGVNVGRGDDIKAYSEELDRLRAKFNPLFQIGVQYRQSVEEIREAHRLGAIGAHEMQAAIEEAGSVASARQAVYTTLRERFDIIGGSAKLTGDQLRNLSFQLNDTVTMALSGASAFQILATQGGQVFQALQEGPRGVKGSLEGIAEGVLGIVQAIGPTRLAFIALGIAGAGAAYLIGRSFPSATEVAEKHADVIKRATERYDGLSEAIKRMRQESANAIRVDLSSQTSNAERLYRSQVAGLVDYAIPSGLQEWDSVLQPIADQVRAFQEQLADGSGSVRAMREELRAFSLEAGATDDEKTAVRAFLEMTEGASATELQLGELGATVRGMSAEFLRFEASSQAAGAALSRLMQAAPPDKSAFEQLTKDFRKWQEASKDLIGPSQAPDLYRRAVEELIRAPIQAAEEAAQRLANMDLGENDRLLAEIRQRAEAEIAELERVNGAEEAIAARRRQMDAELGIARRETADEASKEADEYTKALTNQSARITDQVAALRLQAEMFGESEGAMAAAEARTRMLADAYALARENNQIVTPAQVAEIEAAAAEIGVLTERVRELREEEERRKEVADTIANLQFETSLIGLSETDREVASTLRDLQVSYESMDGQRIAGAIQYRSEQERVYEQLEQERKLFENIGSTFLDIFTDTSSDGFFDRILGGLADISRQFAELGKQRLMDMFLPGANYTTGQSAPGQRSVAAPGFPAGFAANDNGPGGLNVRAVSALNDNLVRSSRSALDVARQFDGLNERADSAVLDSFMQASGNWKNLSAEDTAWCAAFANAALVESGQRGTGSNLASSFMGWGQGTNAPQIGDIVVLKPQARGASGHVGFVAGFGDGTVQVFGGNQSNGANTRSFGLDQVSGYRTSGDPRALTRAVSDGQIDAARRLATGSVSGTPYAGPAMSSQAAAAMAGGWSGFGPMPGQGGVVGGSPAVGIRGFMQSPFGQGAMNALGAFGSGYSSGSPIGGALTGGLGALGAGLGPVGIIAGAAAGLFGGLFGKDKQKEAEHKQRASAWAQMGPEWSEYQRMLVEDVGPRSGLRAAYKAIDDQMVRFVAIGGDAHKYGKDNSSAYFNKVSQTRVGYQERTNHQFWQTLQPTLDSLNRGQGLEGPFVQAHIEIAELGKALATFVDDASLVFGEGSEPHLRATEAAIAQLSSILNGSEELTEVGAAVKQMEGAAAGLRSELEKLGVSAHDAGLSVGEDLTIAMERLRGSFSQGIQDELWAINGKSYLSDFRQFFVDIDEAIQDAILVGADRSLVDQLFIEQAQAMVDGARLSGDAFAELIGVFPRLEGVVREFLETAQEAERRTADALKALRLSYDDRVFATTIDTSTEAGALARFDRFAAREREEEIRAGGEAILDLERALAAERGQIIKDFAEQAAEETKRALESAQSFLDGFTRDIGSYLDGLRAGPESPLSAKDRVAEAQRQFDEQLVLARGGDRDALSSITSYADRLLEASRGYNASSPSFQADFAAITQALEGLPKQLKAEDIVAAEIAKAAAETQAAIRQAASDLAGRVSTDFDRLDLSVDGLLDYDELRRGLEITDAELRRIFTELDFNGDDQISRLEALLAADGLTRSTLQDALTAGPNATALALSPHFSRLDTSVNGLLDISEMRTALGGIATDAQIRQMMSVLDANGDGQLSVLELLNTKGGTQISQGAELQSLTRLVWQTGTNSASYQERIRHYTELSYGVLGTISTSLSQSLSMQERIRANLAAANGAQGYQQYAKGGIANRPSIFGEAGPEAAVPLPDGRTIPVTLSMQRMPAMPIVANSNRALESEVRGLRSDVARLERALVQATMASGERSVAATRDLTEETRKGNRTADRKARAA